MGCGTGNSIYPLLRFQNLKFMAFDLSSTAIKCFKNNKMYDADRINCFQMDAVEQTDFYHQNQGKFDFVTIIFFLSAFKREQMEGIVGNVNKVVKKGGYVLFRDYGEYDMAMIRLHKNGQKVDCNLYQKQDGIFTFFFNIEVLTALFQPYFDLVDWKYCTISRSNNKKQQQMVRVFLNARFIKR